MTELHLVFIQLSKLVAPFRLIEPSIIIFKICCFKGSISKSVETWLVLLVLAIAISRSLVRPLFGLHYVVTLAHGVYINAVVNEAKG